MSRLFPVADPNGGGLESTTGLNYFIRTHTDDGCDVSPACVSCPLSVCRYEGRTGRLALNEYRLQGTWALIRELRVAGLKPVAIGARLGVSPRTVTRYERRMLLQL